ncbi:protein of unknown function [Methylocella tundrae]|uniref:Uncharacterized protein n=1 Tax=Methylocella tundrae TaxID=227605 RepID=A0A4U8YWM0_METTU|nr:protein of unknown function [Methylocella tundrae]
MDHEGLDVRQRRALAERPIRARLAPGALTAAWSAFGIEWSHSIDQKSL